MASTKIFFKNTFMMYILTGCNYLFSLIILPYLTRVLEAETYGVIVFLTGTMQYFQVFIDFGFMFSATKNIAENQNNKYKISKIIFSVVYSKIILAGLAFIIFIILIPFIPILQKFWYLGLLYFLATAMSVFSLEYLYRGIERMTIITISTLIIKTTTLLLTFICIKSTDDVILVPIINIIGTLLACAFTWIYAYKSVGVKFALVSTKEISKEMRYSFTFFIATFSSTLFCATNTLFMGIADLPTEDIACWGLAYQIINAAQLMFTPIINSLFPHIAACQNYSIAKRLILVIEPLIILACIIGFFICDPILKWFTGPGYDSTTIAFQLLLPLLVFSFPAQIIGFPVLGNMGIEKKVSTTTAIAAIFHISVTIALFMTNNINIYTLAILRTSTEFLLLIQRIWLLWRMKKARSKTN